MMLLLMIRVRLIHRDLLFQNVCLQFSCLRRIRNRRIDEWSYGGCQFGGLYPERIGEMKDLRFHVVL